MIFKLINPSWLYLLMAAFNSTIGNILLKKSRVYANEGFFLQYFNFLFIFGIFFYGINVLLFAKALDELPVSIAYPVLSVLSFVFLSLVSTLFLSEKLNSIQLFGLLFSIIGLVLLTRGD